MVYHEILSPPGLYLVVGAALDTFHVHTPSNLPWCFFKPHEPLLCCPRSDAKPLCSYILCAASRDSASNAHPQTTEPHGSKFKWSTHRIRLLRFGIVRAHKRFESKPTMLQTSSFNDPLESTPTRHLFIPPCSPRLSSAKSFSLPQPSPSRAQTVVSLPGSHVAMPVPSASRNPTSSSTPPPSPSLLRLTLPPTLRPPKSPTAATGRGQCYLPRTYAFSAGHVSAPDD